MVKGFRDFLLRGNVVDLAIAVVIGAAFGALVTATTTAFIKPLIGVFLGGGADAGVWTVRGQDFDVTLFLNAVVTFVVTAAVVYFFVVVPLNALMERRRRSEVAEPAATPEDIALLRDIRDLLAARNGL